MSSTACCCACSRRASMRSTISSRLEPSLLGPIWAAATMMLRAMETSSRLYRVGIVLTLVTGKSEGHLAYRSQSDNPLQGTTLGGSADDPRREGTRTAPACHPARPGAGQCQSGVPGSGDLPRAVLPLAPPAGALRGGWGASAAVSGPPRSAGRTGSGDGAAGAECCGECGDVGRGPHHRLCRATVGPARGPQYCAAGAAARGLGN